MSGRAYTYDPAGRRDPFRSLLVREQNRGGVSRPPGIAGIAIDDLVVHGIWKTHSGFVAQIRATDNKSYLIRAGDLLYDGEVTRVGPNEVSFRQNLNDPQSVKPFREVTKQLNATVANATATNGASTTQNSAQTQSNCMVNCTNTNAGQSASKQSTTTSQGSSRRRRIRALSRNCTVVTRGCA